MNRIARTTDITICRILRRRVFIGQQGVSEADAMDDPDGRAVHLLAITGRCPVGPARLLTAENSGRIGRVCVLPQARGRAWVPR